MTTLHVCENILNVVTGHRFIKENVAENYMNVGVDISSLKCEKCSHKTYAGSSVVSESSINNVAAAELYNDPSSNIHCIFSESKR